MTLTNEEFVNEKAKFYYRKEHRSILDIDFK